MRTLNLGVDLDGVTCNFSKKFTEIANQLYGDRCPIDNCYHEYHDKWNFEEWYPITKDEVKEVWKVIRATVNFWETLDILNEDDFKYFRETMENLTNVNVYFITARANTQGKSVVNQSIKWLENAGWKSPQVILADNKYDICRDMKIDFFIDDKPENIIEIKLVNSQCEVFITDYRYNTMADVVLGNVKGFYRVKGLREFTNKVCEYIVSIQ